MAKYWNVARIRRVKKRRAEAELRAREQEKADAEQRRTYTSGDPKKNVGLMLDALGTRMTRRMFVRLIAGGAMSVSKLCDPFHMTLPSALEHVRLLERAGIITTHKRGRIRMCVYRPGSLKELGTRLAARNPEL